jgi:uroporphyrinogen-III synthase
MNRARVWVTRTDPFNRLTVKRLAAAGYDAVGAPVLAVVPLAVPPVVKVPDALILTSLNAVRLHRFVPAFAGLPLFAVGDRTARYARARGYRCVASAGGDVQALCRLIRAELNEGADMLHPGAVDTAGDLEALLEHRFRVRKLPVYDVRESDPRDLEWICGALQDIDHVLIHSPRAGRYTASLIRDAAPRWPGSIHCISEAAAAPFRSNPDLRVVVADHPDERSLLGSLGAGGAAIDPVPDRRDPHTDLCLHGRSAARTKGFFSRFGVRLLRGD